MKPRVAEIAMLGVVIVGALVLVYGGSRAPERSEHAEPAKAAHFEHAVPDTVAVTPDGKLFHDPSCTHIHGPVETMPREEAERRGYSPCPWCLPTAR